jgi:hypothetical protein
MPNSSVPAAAAGLPKDPLSFAFRLVGDMENPLATIDDLLTALAMIAETLDDEDARVVQRLAWIAKDHCSAIGGHEGRALQALVPEPRSPREIRLAGQ